MSWPFLIESEMAIIPVWKKVESPMKTTCLLSMKGSMPAPVPPPKPMPERLCISSENGAYLSME